MGKIEIIREWRIAANDNVEWQNAFRKVCDELKHLKEEAKEKDQQIKCLTNELEKRNVAIKAIRGIVMLNNPLEPFDKIIIDTIDSINNH